MSRRLYQLELAGRIAGLKQDVADCEAAIQAGGALDLQLDLQLLSRSLTSDESLLQSVTGYYDELEVYRTGTQQAKAAANERMQRHVAAIRRASGMIPAFERIATPLPPEISFNSRQSASTSAKGSVEPRELHLLTVDPDSVMASLEPLRDVFIDKSERVAPAVVRNETNANAFLSSYAFGPVNNVLSLLDIDLQYIWSEEANRIGGIPDFTASDTAEEVKLVGEGKAPSVLPPRMDLHARWHQRQPNKIRQQVIPQLIGYIDQEGLQHGFLATFESLWLVMWDDQSQRAFVTRRYGSDAQRPSVMQLLVYWAQAAEKAAAGELVDFPPVTSLPVPHRSSITTRSASLTATAGAGTSQQATQPQAGRRGGSGGSGGGKRVVLADGQLEVSTQRVGNGVTGVIWLGRWQDSLDCAVKSTEVGKRRHVLEMLQHEEATYRQLEPLWGKSIPRLLTSGLAFNGTVYFLALELVVGTHPEQLPAPADSELINNAEQALAGLHAADVLHGDIRSENIIVLETKQVMLIDLGQACASTSRKEKEEEMALFMEVMGATASGASSDTGV